MKNALVRFVEMKKQKEEIPERQIYDSSLAPKIVHPTPGRPTEHCQLNTEH